MSEANMAQILTSQPSALREVLFEQVNDLCHRIGGVAERAEGGHWSADDRSMVTIWTARLSACVEAVAQFETECEVG